MDVEELLNKFIESDSLENGIIYVEELIIITFDAVYILKDKCIKITQITKIMILLNILFFTN